MLRSDSAVTVPVLEHSSCDRREEVIVQIEVMGAIEYIHFTHPIDIASHLVPTRRVTGVYNFQGRALSCQGL
jgi:hypothetical protein